jgi:hypothetical protein
MTQPPGLDPEQFHELVVDAVGGLKPASPPMEAIRRRAIRRQRGRRAALALTFAGVVAAAGTVGFAVSSSVSDNATVTPIGPRPVAQPTRSLSPQQLLAKEYPKPCPHRYARWRFIHGLAASYRAHPVEQIVGHPGYVACGGPSDIAYLDHKGIENLTLAPGAVVRVVHLGGSGSQTRPIAPGKLHSYLIRADQTNFFRYVGPKQAVTKLVELYHP